MVDKKRYLMTMNQGSHGLHPAANVMFRVNNSKAKII